MQQVKHRVSIIIPVYNEEKTIIEILGLVNKQKIDQVEFEIIVVDDGSRDGTKEAVLNLKNNI